MPALITRDEALGHLKLVDDPTWPATMQADLQSKIDESSAAIVGYLADQADETWTETTAPPVVKAAIKLHLGLMDRNRGDNGETADRERDAERTWLFIQRVLRQLRDPIVA